MFAYAITDPSTLHFETLADDLAHFSKRASMIVYRDKNTLEYAKNAQLFVAYAQSFDKVLLHGDYLLSKVCQADGVHLQSTQFDDIAKAKALDLFVIVSTHSIDEAKTAQLLGADMVTFSPVFDTPNKAQAVGIDSLKKVISAIDIPVIALGGILTQKQIDACADAGAKGFASIRYYRNPYLDL